MLRPNRCNFTLRTKAVIGTLLDRKTFEAGQRSVILMLKAHYHFTNVEVNFALCSLCSYYMSKYTPCVCLWLTPPVQ